MQFTSVETQPHPPAMNNYGNYANLFIYCSLTVKATEIKAKVIVCNHIYKKGLILRLFLPNITTSASNLSTSCLALLQWSVGFSPSYPFLSIDFVFL